MATKATTSGVDSSRQLLRHTLATLAYRAGKALRGAPDSFASFSTGEKGRTPAHILAHMGDLFDWALSIAKGRQEWHDSTPQPWPHETERFFKTVQAFDDYLASDAPMAATPQQLFQGRSPTLLLIPGKLRFCAAWPAAPCAGKIIFARKLPPAALARTRPRLSANSDRNQSFCAVLRAIPRYSSISNSMKNLLMAVCLAFILAAPAAAQKERILSFDSRITVNPDGGMQVTETIGLESDGVDIVHGIYRDFPTRYKDRAGNGYSVLFQVVSLSRDGNSEPYHTEDLKNGVRVYFGSSSYDLPPGPHGYQFTYRTNRQLGFFADHDELYWNVTGNGWKFPIDAATTTVFLPANVRGSVTSISGYTGDEGEKGQAYTARRDDDGNPTFRAENFAPRQGLTIVVTWPKGLIAPPSAEQKRAWFIADNKPAIFGFAGLIVVFLYYLMIWGMVGRDPAHGTIVPLYGPPDNMSPAAIRFLERMGFDQKAFTAGIMGLAAKGFLSIEQDDAKTYKLVRKNNAALDGLSADEKSLARTLFEEGSPLVLKNTHHALLARAQKDLETNLHATMEKNYFVTNSRYLWPGIILSLLNIAAMLVQGGGSQIAVGLFMSVWLTGWTFGVYALLSSVVRAWRSAKTEGVLGAGQAGFLTLFSIPFLAGECFGLGLLFFTCGAAAFCIIAATIGVNVVFHHLLKAPTLAGRALMDRVDGFKSFLTAVDADRLRTMVPPDKTPQLFERFLPFALALGVEHAWAEQFSQVLARAATAEGSGTGTGYSPSWYSGGGFNSFSASDFTSGFSSSFSSAISSSSTAPGSSSGSSGGGSSGGGGGGGGGGGW
ncbi:MAG TPA: DUF2207 domain-containing protein [Candidatus Angelobacter sp.]|nr:DUF2207 domain-containing protein [Candidatus Angelobacter sp.]